MDISVEKQSSPTETKPVVDLGSVWIDASHESIIHVRIATEDSPLPNAVSMCFSKYRGKLISLDADSIINPERHKKIWPAPDVNAGLLAALENIECPDCGHLLKCHADRHGCEFDMGDRHMDDLGMVAVGPCSCTCEDLPDLQAAVEAIRLAKGGRQTTDPRGPIRIIKAIEETPSATLLTMDCGHVGSHAPHFSYATGDSLHCFQCGPKGGAQ